MNLYSLLLRLYPASFRHAYGAEMASILESRLRRAPGLGRAGVWLRAAADVLTNAPAAHFDLLWQDLKYCRRSLAQAPAFAATVIATTALAVGAASTILTLADQVFLHPLPFDDPDRLVRMWEVKPGYSQMEASPANFRDWQGMATSFEQMAGWRGRAVNLTGVHEPIHLEGASVTARLFDVLRVRPLIGRLFVPADDLLSSPATLVLSENLWREQFGADPGVLGRTVSLDDRPHIVIGVMPATVHFPSRVARFWTPMQFAPGDFEDRANNFIDVVARLKPGVTLRQARAEMVAIAANLERAYPTPNAKTGATVIAMRDQVDWWSRLILGALAAASVCFLLIACLNLASLFIARALARRRELAIRTALGAGPERLVRQLATESFLLAGAGGLLGIAIASLALPLLGRLVPQSLPIGIPELDLRAVAIAALLSIACGLLFGVAPAIRTSRVSAVEGLREGARQGIGSRRQRARSILVVAEVSLSLALLVSTGLLVRALWNVQAIDPGFRTEGVLTVRTPLPMPKYEQTGRRTQFYDRVLNEARALPGVKGAAYISFLPIAFQGGVWNVFLAGRDTQERASLRFVTPGFFDAMQIPLLRGRDVRQGDVLKSQMVAVVSESFARRYWPGQDPIGRQFKIAFNDRIIVGVARDIRVRGLERRSEPQVYLPHEQAPDGWLTWYAPKDLVIATQSDEAALQLPAAIRRIIREADSEQPVTNVQLLSDIVRTNTATRRLQVMLLSGFAGMALLLAAIGLYGLLAYNVSQRTQEFGVRIALGARAMDVFGIVLRECLSLTAIGLLAGTAVAAVAVRSLGALLYGVKPADAASWAAAIALCAAATMLGALRPAARAAKVDPMEAIRRE